MTISEITYDRFVNKCPNGFVHSWQSNYLFFYLKINNTKISITRKKDRKK